MRGALLALACAGCATSPATDNFNQPIDPGVPRDVRLFVIDAQACGHFSGEIGDGEERRAFLDRMIKETCTSLDKRKAELTARFKQSARIRQLILDVAG